MPYETKTKDVDFPEYINRVEEHLKGRKQSGALKSEADYLVGAMIIFDLLKEWPPSHWVFDIMSGKSVLEREEETEEA